MSIDADQMPCTVCSTALCSNWQKHVACILIVLTDSSRRFEGASGQQQVATASGRQQVPIGSVNASQHSSVWPRLLTSRLWSCHVLSLVLTKRSLLPESQMSLRPASLPPQLGGGGTMLAQDVALQSAYRIAPSNGSRGMWSATVVTGKVRPKINYFRRWSKCRNI